MCETNPICPLDGVGRGRPTHEEPTGELCETNPISPAGGRPGGKRAKQTQFAPERCEGQVLYGQRFMVNWTYKGLRRNKANSPRCRGGRGLEDEGQLCETNPISLVGQGRGERDAQNEANFRRSRAGRGPRGVGRGAIVQNEANSRRRRVGRGPRARGNRAKRTQFPGGGGWDGATGTWDEGQMRKTNPISGQPSGWGRPIVQNEANFRPAGRRERSGIRHGTPATLAASGDCFFPPDGYSVPCSMS